MAVPRWMKATAMAGALVLGVAACGDDDDVEAPAAAEATGSESTESDDDTTMDEEMPATVVDIAAGNDDFSTLVAAVEAADLVETLQGDGPFTVFAPTNAAFEALPAGTVDTLLKPENKDQLAAVLTYHVVPSKAMSTDLSDGMTVKTVQGEELTVGISGGTVTITDANGGEATVAQADIEAENGVVHVIDKVLLPAG